MFQIHSFIVQSVTYYQSGYLYNQHFSNSTVTFLGEGKWFRNIDYYRLDGSTTAQSRKKWAEEFNDETNMR